MDSEFAAALRSPDADDALSSLADRSDASSYAIGRLNDPDPEVRVAACDLLGRAADVHEEARPVAAEALLSIAVPDSVESLVYALGRTYDARVVPRLLEHIAHPDADVRLAVAWALPNVLLDWDEPEPPGVTEALIGLSGDADEEVRDWATFGLGRMSNFDGPQIRAALLARTTDSFQDAREEGICGLARRRDPRGIALLGDLLAEETLQIGVFDTAALVGDASYLSRLEAFDVEDTGIADAMRECDPVRRAARDEFAWQLMATLAAQRPELEPTLYCERFEPGISLAVNVAGTCRSYDIDRLMANEQSVSDLLAS
ncbi:MAG TPA: HEAT repeat domain-containing protein [Micromonosporaceae bacterium]